MNIYRLLFALFKPENCNNHYLKRYLKLIGVYTKRNMKKQKGYHRHHIIPKHFDGGENPKNKVILKPKEHFIIHHILYKAFPNSGMAIAFFAMCNGWDHYGFRITSRIYEQLSLAHSERQSKRLKGIPKGPPSAAHCQAISDGLKGIPKSAEQCQAMRVPKRSRSAAHCQAISDFRKNLPKKECPYCHRMISINLFSRWHGDKCKAKLISQIS